MTNLEKIAAFLFYWLCVPFDYYPFGMLVPNRHKDSPEYRYGFQGQEKDDEVKGGDGNSINYTFRMHDPRIGRFFAVDPLTKKYPHYTPYSFSGNKVIDHTELEGLEDLSIHVNNVAAPNNPGNAILTITMEHQIVTSGIGEVHNRHLINPQDYTTAYAEGNTILYSTNLPSPTQSANFLSKKYERWARKATTSQNPEKRAKFMNKLTTVGITEFYALDVRYDYSLNIVPNTSLNDAVAWASQDLACKGIVFNPEANLRASINAADFNKYKQVYNSVFGANVLGLQLGPDHGAAGLSEGMSGGKDPATNLNMVATNPKFFGKGSNYNFSLDATNVMVHEIGHNNAAVNIHNTGSYEYNQNGTQSNSNPKPTKENTKNTINDDTNRKSL